MNDTEREALLDQLGNIRFAVFMTALTSEMCLEVIILNEQGLSYSWIGFDEWNVYKLSFSNYSRQMDIKNKIQTNSLKSSDLQHTAFEPLISQILGEVEPDYNCSELLSSLLKQKDNISNPIYCYYDCDNSRIEFFKDQTELSEYLARIYTATDKRWNDMETDELRYWKDRLESEGYNIPCTEYDE